MRKIPYLAFWIYLASALTIPFPFVLILNNYGFSGTGEGLAYDIGTVAGQSLLIGGAILGLYYALKSTNKKIKKPESLDANSK